MASNARVVLNGRFRPGTDVDLYERANERVLSAEGSEKVGSATVDENGRVEFTDVRDGARYFIVGYNDGFPVTVPITATSRGDLSQTMQAPTAPERVKLSDGSFLDEPPKHRGMPAQDVGPRMGQDQMPPDAPQRIVAPRGEAFPSDPSESVPAPRQEDMDEDAPQMVSAETGEAFPSIPTVDRQEDADGINQRINADTGQAFPIPSGDALHALEARDSSEAKVARGESGAAAQPLKARRKPGSKES